VSIRMGQLFGAVIGAVAAVGEALRTPPITYRDRPRYEGRCKGRGPPPGVHVNPQGTRRDDRARRRRRGF